jgi:DNA-binding response OmpR family regulator
VLIAGNGRGRQEKKPKKPFCGKLSKSALGWRGNGMHRILIVDDEPNIVFAMELLMKREGYEVHTVDEGEKVFPAVREFKPDLILLDIMLPKIDGYEVCQRIRADAALKDIRIIMITAKGRDVEKEKGLALGADYYITKPFSTREVVMRVKEILAAGPER